MINLNLFEEIIVYFIPAPHCSSILSEMKNGMCAVIEAMLR